MLSSLSSSFMQLSPALIKAFENKKFKQFRISKKNYFPLHNHHIKALKKEQLIVGMAFRFFGLQNMPNYRVNNAFLENTSELEFPRQATELLHELQKNTDFADNGCIYSNSVTKYKSDLALEKPDNNLLSYSIAIEEKEIVLVYNTSKSEACEKFVLLNRPTTKDCSSLETIYGYDTSLHIQVFQGLFNDITLSYMRLYLKPMQLIILKNFN